MTAKVESIQLKKLVEKDREKDKKVKEIRKLKADHQQTIKQIVELKYFVVNEDTYDIQEIPQNEAIEHKK